MFHRLTASAKANLESIRSRFGAKQVEGNDAQSLPNSQSDLQSDSPAQSKDSAKHLRLGLLFGGLALASWFLIKNPPIQSVAQGEVGVRVNQLTGGASEHGEGSVLMFPVLHSLKTLSLQDQTYRPEAMRSATGGAALQSLEGLAIGVDIGVRYAIEPRMAGAFARFSDDAAADKKVDAAMQGTVYKTFARYTVREIYSSKRMDIQKELEKDLTARLASDGITVRNVQVGKVDLPADYRRGMEGLLAEELASEKMRYTLELKEKQVKETELTAVAEKTRREITAEAAGREQIIAAKAQEEAMKHVLPFKQRQIEQRQLEAEADRVSRTKIAQGSAEARRIEASGEADARVKLAEAEVSRMDKLGRVGADQMAREGALLTKHPLLIQKAMVDKLSDKVQVIIAPPSDGGFIAGGLLGMGKRDTGGGTAAGATKQTTAAPSAQDGEKTAQEKE